MSEEPKEYPLDALLEHPVLGMQMAAEGLERRYLDLILGASGLRRPTDGGREAAISMDFCP
jgi:hypothetical protein